MNPFEIAKQALSSKPKEETSAPAQEAPALPTDYAALAANGHTEFDVQGLDEAIFLFALNLVRSCPDAEFMNMGHAYCPFWRERLMPEAWRIVVAEIKIRLGRLKEGQPAEDHQLQR